MKEMSYDGYAKRIDLNLRARFVELNTKIFKISETRYLICCENCKDDFAVLQKEFDGSIRILGTPIELTNKEPLNFVAIIPQISDKEIAKNFEGIPMSKFDLLNLLLGKFPKINFHKIDDDKWPIKVMACLKKDISEREIGDIKNEDRDAVLKFLAALNQPPGFELIEEKVLLHIENQKTIHNPNQYIYSGGFLKNPTPEYIQRDQELWFENIDKIFQGDYKKSDLYFYNSKEYACYVDYSICDNIDLRNHLFLFQTIFLAPPFNKNIFTWLDEKKILLDEFFELIKRNRIKIVLTQSENQYDRDFLREVYKHNTNGLITRRAIAALVQIDLVDIADNYIWNEPKLIEELKDLCVLLNPYTKVKAELMFEILVWPIKARRRSFQGLHTSGILSSSFFGVNTAIEKNISSAFNRDLSLEFQVSSSSIHLANALNAIYFPFTDPAGFSDYYFATVMGDFLNFYRNATPDNIKPFLETKINNSAVLQINPIDVIEVNDFISITELEKELSKDIIYPSSKRLMEHLADLTPEERKRKILLYNEEVSKKLNKKQGKGDYIDLGTNVLMDVAGALTNFSALGSVFSILKIGGKKMKSSIPLIKNIAEKVESILYKDIDQQNIHYLTKINRVARIKRMVK